MLQVKNILCDLVDYAYDDNNPKKDLYKKFYIEVSEQNKKSFHGDYDIKTHHIRIFNTYRDDASIIVTTIHELTHHIDNCNRGTSDHSKEFYTIFEHLLKTGLNMGLFSKEQFFAATADASDSKKVRKMIEDYEPVPIAYKKDVLIVRVRNCFDIKEQLKARGYHFNSIEKSWELETSEVENEKKFLDNVEIDIEYEVSDKYMSFQRKSYICASKGSFEVKNELKEDGFFFENTKKVWKKEGNREDLNVFIKKYPGVEWLLM